MLSRTPATSDSNTGVGDTRYLLLSPRPVGAGESGERQAISDPASDAVTERAAAAAISLLAPPAQAPTAPAYVAEPRTELPLGGRYCHSCYAPIACDRARCPECHALVWSFARRRAMIAVAAVLGPVTWLLTPHRGGIGRFLRTLGLAFLVGVLGQSFGLALAQELAHRYPHDAGLHGFVGLVTVAAMVGTLYVTHIRSVWLRYREPRWWSAQPSAEQRAAERAWSRS